MVLVPGHRLDSAGDIDTPRAHLADCRGHVVLGQPASEDHLPARGNCRSLLPVDRLARAAVGTLVNEGPSGKLELRCRSLAQDRPADHARGDIECRKVSGIRLQNIRFELVADAAPVVRRRVAHHGNPVDLAGEIPRRLFGLARRHAADRLGEHKAYGIGSGSHGRGHVVGTVQAADFDEHSHAALLCAPAERSSATSARGLALRISAVPTSASR